MAQVPGNPVRFIYERNDFYKNSWRMLAPITAGVTIALLVAIGIIITLLNRNQEPRYFQVTPAGQLVEMAPTNVPYVRTEQLLGFTELVARKIFTLNFKEYREQLENARQLFTQDGYSSFRQAIQSAGMVDYIIQNRAISSVALEAPPVLVSQGIAGSVYAWKVQMPVMVSYDSGMKKTSPQRQILTLTVVRQPTWENPRGIAVSAIVMR